MGYYVKNAGTGTTINITYPTIEDAFNHCPSGCCVYDDVTGKRVGSKMVPYEYNDQTEVASDYTEQLSVYEHDKYRYIWEKLKVNITERISCLQESSLDTENLAKHLERVVEERELMRIMMMMKSLENNEPILKEV